VNQLVFFAGLCGDKCLQSFSCTQVKKFAFRFWKE